MHQWSPNNNHLKNQNQGKGEHPPITKPRRYVSKCGIILIITVGTSSCQKHFVIHVFQFGERLYKNPEMTQNTCTLNMYKYTWPSEKKCPQIMERIAMTFIQSSQTSLSDCTNLFSSIYYYLWYSSANILSSKQISKNIPKILSKIMQAIYVSSCSDDRNKVFRT